MKTKNKRRKRIITSISVSHDTGPDSADRIVTGINSGKIQCVDQASNVYRLNMPVADKIKMDTQKKYFMQGSTYPEVPVNTTIINYSQCKI
jgi:hypothetical protein